jgi:hypothetical protein
MKTALIIVLMVALADQRRREGRVFGVLRRSGKGLVRAKHHVAEVPVDLHELVGSSILFNPAILQHQERSLSQD